MYKTVQIILKPTKEQSKVLYKTMLQFTKSFNIVCKVGWKQHNGNACTLHRLTYRYCRKVLPNLVSDFHVQARQKAAAAIKSTIAVEKKGWRVSCPHSLLCSPRYDLHTFKLDWERGIVNLASVKGRVKIPFNLYQYARYAADYPTPVAELTYRKGVYCLHVCVKLPDVKFISNGKAVGVDLGITRPAVSSDNRFHGNRHMAEVVNKTFRLKRVLRANGSKSAKRHLRSLAGREQRYRRDCDHVISSAIVKGMEAGTVVVLENLKNIRSRIKMYDKETSRRFHVWSYAQLKRFLEYKAEQIGCRVVAVDPKRTSQRCSRCGYIHKDNRRSLGEFLCVKCDFHLNADLQASRNIRDKYLVGWGISPSDALSSTSVLSQPSHLVRDKLTV